MYRESSMPANKSFRAQHVDREATITVHLPFDETFELFTPEGERDWVPGWAPEYLHRAEDDGVDTAFRTHHDGEETLWMVLEHDLDEGCIGYARVTPESRLGTVMIDVEAIDDTSCWVTVCYELTALTASGNRLLEGFTQEMFERKMADWEARIARLAPASGVR
jgi:hypothetical protein